MGVGLKPSENAECRAMVQNLRARGCWVCKIASGADIGNKRVIQILKSLGLVSGVPDYIVVFPGGGHVWLEMKVRSGGSVSKAQRACHHDLAERDEYVIVGKGAEHAVAEVERVAEEWGCPLPQVDSVVPMG